ncbi:hypothetical protein [Pedobacter psychrodurus]|jgi:hypothetical protein|uniref:hypothetical protein n=1 Tax=Pedobacter psychrodurus TaxID=2530456 RepID=UPI00293138AC|nr:hypothetical protein [Pedobacter psychrodurus]
MIKKINVLVDLPDFGIIDLPLAYTLGVESGKPDVYLANCKVLLHHKKLPSWLHTPTFSITYTKSADESGYMVSICADKGTTNLYHETMLNIVSSYIKRKEDLLV